MKIIYSVFALFAAAALFGIGCATSLKTEQAANITISAAMSGWNDYVGQFHPSVVEELKVKAAFEKAQAAELLAIDASKGLMDLTATNAAPVSPADQSAARAKVTAASQSAAATLADLVGVIQSFGVPLTSTK